ncbi:hypothetical protein SAMN05421664_0903 [Chryseobacterium soldanellicola]|uniref:VIT domain-containing protein n=1 Tax=Chryseobacterium soldanellicola TaxID=311333 RepID=A0A1H0YS25_9FLAO|nr:VIT domain-containing protein [Chryseobacterium soldanellicola]SDQ17920.1 hypothetical protein SAMN05421664_0903 [Chryseobacterium soldanellicola]
MKSLYIQFLLLLPILCWAQIPIIETPDKKGGFDTNNKVVLQKLNIETKITGGISTNVVTMVFRNNSSRLMEGRLTFPLPEDVNVSGYALDINGKLRNAVPVEKEKAKEVFETIEKRNVDPGILEKVEGNNFRTRIYPINANGGERIVQITYNYELKKSGNNYQYYLPLNYSSEIPEFTIKTSVFQNAISPQLEERPDGSYNFVKNGNIWVAETHKKDYRPSRNLKINFPKSEENENVLLQKASNGSAYFLASLDVDPQERAKKLPNKLAIVWDNSLSGSKRDHKKEFELLDEYFKVNKGLSVNVYFINNTFDEGKTFKIHNGNWSELKSYLSMVSYDGGTDFGQLKSLREDEVLFFTDGFSSFGDLKLSWENPVYTIAASNNANFNQLKFISNKTGGEFLNLNENLPSKEVRKLLYEPLKFLGIENNSSLSEVYPSLPQSISESFVVTGILNGSQTTVKVMLGYGNKVTETKTISLDANRQMVNDWEISQFWAQKKMNELEIFEKKNKNEIKNLSKQFGIVSNNMSLMVLENLADYVRYEITPPAELRQEYDKIVKNKQQLKDVRVNDLMKKAEVMTENLKKWWATDFESKEKVYPKPEKEQSQFSPRDSMRSERNIEEVVVLGYSAEPRRVASVSASNRVISESVSANVTNKLQGKASGVLIRGFSSGQGDYKRKEIAESFISKGKITTVDVKSDAEYMKFFQGDKKTEDIYQTYLAQRRDYIETPQYYFDVAQLLFKNNDKKLGLKVLSSIADLDIENEELYKLLAYRLKQAEVFDKELWISQKVLEWRPFDPQSYRDYALALEDNGRYQEALDNLYKILNQSYTREIANRDYGIEETIIMEINELITNHGNKLDLKNINPKIIADLPVNIRVVLNWNKDNTDIDLWVTDPNKERCMYSHKSTEIGGRLSDDFTGGFGPEQFLLKKAIKGKYHIQTNFFDERQINIAGPTAIMAEVYINYATGKQERKIVVFQNQKDSKGNSDGILIGEFEF